MAGYLAGRVKGFTRLRLLPGGVLLLMVAAACSSGAGDNRPAGTSTPGDAPLSTPGPTSTPEPPPGAPPSSLSTPGPTATPEPPPVDTSIHSVPLKDVIFDTFNGGAARLSEAQPALIRRLRDAIRPVYEPVRYQGVEGGDWLSDSDQVVGYVGGGEAYAYPIKFLNFHELVNDTIAGVPVAVTYCPLCGSGVVYDRRLDGTTYVFGNTSALFESDFVMYDHQTGSYWYQVGGEAIVGALTGARLTPLPSATMPWGTWKTLHPGTRVLDRAQAFPQRSTYESDPFAGYERAVDDLRFAFPVTEEKIDTRLPASTITVSVSQGGEEKAYPVGTMGNAVANDTVGGQPVVVFSRDDGPFGTAFSRDLGGRTLTFELQGGTILDIETGSRWDLFGEAVSGELVGMALDPLPTRRAFWFSIAATFPGIALWEPPPG